VIGRHDLSRDYPASSVHTVIFSRVFGPKVVATATSTAASPPRAISTRSMRGLLLRGSRDCPWRPEAAVAASAMNLTALHPGMSLPVPSLRQAHIGKVYCRDSRQAIGEYRQADIHEAT
jgi:hypothetical protein